MYKPHLGDFRAGLSGAGLMQGKTVMANPGRRVLTGSEQGVVVGTSQEAVTAAMQVGYSTPPPMDQASADHEEAKTRLEVPHASILFITLLA